MNAAGDWADTFLFVTAEPQTPTTRPLALPAVLRVAGVSFHPASSRVRMGDLLAVKPEFNNPFDQFACVVMRDEELVGHVPQVLSSRLRATGHSFWTAEVVEVLSGGEHTGLRVRVLPGTAAVGEQPSAGVPAMTEAETVEPVDRPTPSSPRIEVKARSGRLLGTLLVAAGDSVEVLTEDGLRVRYPSGLVDVVPC